MADTNSILWQMADQIRARLGNADLYATKVSLASAVSEQIADTISDLNNRMAVLEGGGGTQVPNLTSQPVTWTNLSEINLSGEKLVNGDFSANGYVQDTNFCLLQSCGLQPNSGSAQTDHTFAVADRPKVVALQTNSGLTQGTIYEIRIVNTSTGRALIGEIGGSAIGWILGRGTTWEVVNLGFDNWTVTSGTLDETKLASGIVKGDGGPVIVQQMFPQSIASGTKLVIKATRADIYTQAVRFELLRQSGGSYSGYMDIDPADGFTEFETTETTYGIRLNTTQTAREVSELSVFQGDKSGGTVQATTNTLQRISGTQGFNAGASTVEAIPGGQDGYFQFQYANSGSVRVGLTYQDVAFDEPDPQEYRLALLADGTAFSDGYNSGPGFAMPGTWLRIRHYSGDNLIKFQKLQTIYEQDPDFVFPTTSGTNYTYQAGSEPIAIALQSAGGLTVGEYYKVKIIRDSDGAFQLRDLDDNVIGWQGASTRTTRWEVVEDVGQDYVTFHTATPLTTNSPLYLDTSLFHNGSSQINDATLVS